MINSRPVDAPTRSTRRARWGMLVTTLVINVALVVTGVTTWVSNREAAVAVGEARASDLLRAVRRGLHEEGEIQEVLHDFEEAGLRYIALKHRDEVIVSAGISQSEDRIRRESPIGPRMRGHPGRLAIEVEPVMSRELVVAARNHLIVTLAIALALFGLALWFWRLGRRADRLEAQLARDRRLAALGEMSAVLGHEIRNPLASLKGHAQLVVERLDPNARAVPSATQVVTEAERIERLVQRVLDFAKTGTVAVAPTDVAAFVRAAIDALGPRAESVVVEATDVRWPLDAPRMQQVLANVIDNALTASPDVTVRAFVNDGLVIEVEDGGRGFPPDELDSIFEPFRTHRIQGTGLGLAIARRIVEAHGGTISAANRETGGAVVRIVIPEVA